MASTISDTTVSPPPFSPFEQGSVTSGNTSDDPPDLGDFTTVWRTFAAYQHPRVFPLDRTDSEDTTPTTSWVFPPSDYESEAAGGSTVWNQGPIASYLNSSSPDTPPESSSSATDTESGVEVPVEGQPEGGLLDLLGADGDDSGQPSLGLAGALDFLAAERAKFVAQREVGLRGHPSTTSDGTWRHAAQPRRKRRRKRGRSAQPAQGDRSAEEEALEGAATSQDDAGDSSFSSDEAMPANYYESTPPSPPHGNKAHRKQRAASEDARPKLNHSKSTPTLRLPVTMPIDARVLQLRNLAHKLRVLFPKDAAALSAILANDQPDVPNFVDPRGPAARTADIPIHIFIDHSNILIGFLSYLRRHTNRISRKSKYLSHAALALILERGRPITRRVLATSSPLYQPVDTAEQLGYEVHVLQRVPDEGDAADRQHGSSSSGGEQGRSMTNSPQYTPRKATHFRAGSHGHSHKSSVGGGTTSADSDTNNSLTVPVPARRRFREQGVDELLQLKVHQAIASVDEVPQDATIVLATGDGNVGQYNEEGFLGCVRLALKKGWRVELYAWEGGLSKMWKREFGREKRFEVHMLDRYAMDLLDL